MKKKNLLVSSIPFLLLAALTGCGGKTVDSGSSEEPGTIQEKVFRRIGDSFSLTGTYTVGMTMTMNNPETGEPVTYDSVMMESTLSSYLCGDFFNAMQDIPAQNYHYDVRVDKNERGDAIVYELDPFKNEVVETSFGGYENWVEFNSLFSSPFTNPNHFEVQGNKLVLTNTVSFDYEKLGYILALGINASSISELTVEFDDSYNPTNIYAYFENDAFAMFGQTQYFKYNGHFTNPSEFDVSPIPTPIPAQDGQSALEAKFASLRNTNFTATTTIYDFDAKVTDVTIKVTSDHMYLDFENSDAEYNYMNLADRGYFQDENGLNYYKLKDGVPTAYAKTNPNYEYEYMVCDLFKLSGYVFNVNDDGSYTLPAYEFSVEPDAYLGTESVYIPGLHIDKGTFNVKLTSDGLSYSYVNDGEFRVETTISAIGTTTIDVDLDQFVPYAPLTDLLEWGQKQMIPNIEYVLNGITNNNPSIIPFYEGQRGGAGFIDVGEYQGEEFPVGITVAQECADPNEEMELYMNFMMEMDKKMSGYHYDFMEDEYIYGSEGDEAYFKVKISFGEYFDMMSGLTMPSAVTLKVTNLNTPEGWVNPWGD